MKSRSTTKRFGGTMAGVLTLAGVLFSLLGQSAAAQQKEQSPDALAAANIAAYNPGLEGTWRVTVTQKVCATGAQIGLPFHSLLTFARGGTLTGTTASPAFLPGQRSVHYLQRRPFHPGVADHQTVDQPHQWRERVHRYCLSPVV